MTLNDRLPRGVTEDNKDLDDYSRYLAGYQHGYEDQSIAGRVFDHMYIFKEGKGWSDHTDYFNLGWIHGFIGVPRALEIVIKLRYDHTGEENAVLAAKSIEDTWDKAFNKK